MDLIDPSSVALTGLIVTLLIVVVVLGVGGAFVVLIVANRADPDPTGRRPFVVYLYGVAFITVWTGLIGALAIVISLVQLIGSHPSRYGSLSAASTTSLHPIGDAAARGVVLGGLVLIVSAITLRLHLRLALGLTASDPDPSSGAKRTARSYVAAVSFLSVLIFISMLVVAIYRVFELAGPGVFGGGGRMATLRSLIDVGFLAIASAAILWAHLHLASPQLWPWRGQPSNSGPPPGSPPGAYGPTGQPYGPGPAYATAPAGFPQYPYNPAAPPSPGTAPMSPPPPPGPPQAYTPVQYPPGYPPMQPPDLAMPETAAPLPPFARPAQSPVQAPGQPMAPPLPPPAAPPPPPDSAQPQQG